MTDRVMRNGRWVLAALTAVYLLFEVAFNARLLDVAGSSAAPRDIDGLELHGRLLSGVGAALLVAGVLFRRGHGLPLSLAFAFPVLPLVFWLQEFAVDLYVAKTEPKTRREAMHLALIPTAVHQGLVVLGPGAKAGQGELEADNLASPAGKALLAVFPALAFGSDLQTKVQSALREIVQGSVEHRIGTAESLYNTTFLAVAEQLRRTYDQKYAPGSERVAAAAAPADAPAQTPWSEYQRELARRNIDPYTASEQQRTLVVGYLRSRHGIPVSKEFQLHDRGAFERAVAQMDRPIVTGPSDDQAAIARKKFAEQVSRELGLRSTLPPGLSWRAFATHPDVQRKAKADLRQRHPDLPETCAAALAGGFKDFRSQCYEPLVSRTINEALEAYRASGEALAPGGQHAAAAERAVRRVVVPPIALGFSLFFGVLNAAGLAMELLFFWRASAQTLHVRAALQAALLVAIVGLPLLRLSPIEQSMFVSGLKGQLYAQGHHVRASTLTWVLRAEPAAYPVANAIRAQVLRGYDFGAPGPGR